MMGLMRHNWRWYLALAVVFFVGYLFFNFSVSSRRPSCKNCNIIIVALDTVGADHLPCFGYTRNTAPNLCAFAEKNVLFQNAYATSSWTLPSDVSIFTSWYPAYHGITTFENYSMRLPKAIPLLPEILQKSGYTTYFGVPANDRAFPVKDIYYKGISQVIPVGFGPNENLDGALNTFLTSVAAGRKTFLYLHSYYAHGPYLIQGNKKMFTNDYLPTIPLSWDEIYNNFSEDFYAYLVSELSKIAGQSNTTIDPVFVEKLKNAPNLAEAKKLIDSHKATSPVDDLESYYTEYYYFAKINLKDPRQVEYVKALYDQKIFELDTWIGNTLLPFLNNPILKDNTIVIVTSEHGEEFMEHARLTHVTLYDANIRVPFIVSVPGTGSRTISAPVSGVDIAPTLLDLVGITRKPYTFQGVSLSGAMKGEVLADRLIFADGFNAENGQIRTVRNAKWKLFTKEDHDIFVPYELYDMANDPAERTNVLASHLPVVTELTRRQYLYDKKWQRIMKRLF